jgi:hypothetical protein
VDFRSDGVLRPAHHPRRRARLSPALLQPENRFAPSPIWTAPTTATSPHASATFATIHVATRKEQHALTRLLSASSKSWLHGAAMSGAFRCS